MATGGLAVRMRVSQQFVASIVLALVILALLVAFVLTDPPEFPDA